LLNCFEDGGEDKTILVLPQWAALAIAYVPAMNIRQETPRIEF